MSRSEKSIKNLLTAVIGQAFGLLISFVSRIVFIRLLGTEYLGLNSLFSNILTVLSLAELGIGEAITFSLYKPLSKNDIKKCKMLMQFYKKVYTYIGIIILILGTLVCPFLTVFIKDLPNIPNLNVIYIMFVVNTSVSYFFSYKRNLIIADQNRYIATIYRYVFYFLLNVVQIIYLLLTRNYLGFLIINIVMTIIENFLVSKKADKMYPYLLDKDKIDLDKETKFEILKNTKAMMMHKVGSVVITSTDNILISSFVGLNAVGLYSNYYMIINALNTIFGQLFNSITASVGNLCAIESKEKQYSVFRKMFFLNFWIYGFSTVCLTCLFNDFITIWVGKSYVFSWNIVLIIIVNYYITGMRKAVLTFREASGLFYKDRWKAIVEAIVNLVTSIVLALKLGIFGVFLGTFISSVSVCVWVEPYVLYKYGFDKNLFDYFKTYLKYLISTIFVCFFCYFGCTFILFNSSLITFIIKTLFCVILSNLLFYIIYRHTDEFNYFYSNYFRKMMIKIKKHLISSK